MIITTIMTMTVRIIIIIIIIIMIMIIIGIKVAYIIITSIWDLFWHKNEEYFWRLKKIIQRCGTTASERERQKISKKNKNCTCADPEPDLESETEARPVVAEDFSNIPGMDKAIPLRSCNRCIGSKDQISYISNKGEYS